MLSAKNWTPATPTLSRATALRLTFPLTLLPLLGAVIVIVGGVVSGGGKGTVKAITAVAVLVTSAKLVAVTVTLWALGMETGAVYKPLLEIVPTAGLIDHDTPVLLAPLTVAVNC